MALTLRAQIVHALTAAGVNALPSTTGDVFMPEYGWLFIEPVFGWKHAVMTKALLDGYRCASVAGVMEALLVVSTWLGEVLVDDPPYQLDVALEDPYACWCRLDLLPDAGATTVSLTLASTGPLAPPDIDDVRDLWVANLNQLGRPD